MTAEPAPPASPAPLVASVPPIANLQVGQPVPTEATPSGPAATGDNRPVRWAGLLTRAQAGEREALSAIVADLTPVLWQVARSHQLDTTSSEDVVQTTWLQLVRHLDEIRTPEALVGWLVTVTRREARRVRDRQRREQTSADPAPEWLSDSVPLPDDQVLRGERDRTLWSAFTRLPERCRELLRVVAFVDRPDYDVVSTALGMPRGSIGPTRGRCLAKLRTLLLADPSWSER
ncbi:RNA polymerase sigma factor [Actinopolymorpha alba]|uniref:RNA polymerase sigma factor n=1 Tax=Actinopolymorpha alba TaxID=533267 RepID=UPI00037C4F93|nr:sigma-70 family RNA polymerase sigma factor [Actinopolymorpha alba]